MPLPQRDHYAYQAYYCEENIWLLCQQPEFETADAIMIAALADCFPMLQQRAATTPQTPIWWDYHVILRWQYQGQPYILDFDSTLGFCTPYQQYLQYSFLAENQLPAMFRPQFRVFSAPEYVTQLRSDRRHMRTAEGWQAPPPTWSAPSCDSSNLAQLVDMHEQECGRVMGLGELLEEM